MSPTGIGKKAKVYKNSSGNSKRLFQQIPRRKNVEPLKIQCINEEEIAEKLSKSKNCCSNGYHFMGCLGKKFVDATAQGESTNISK